MGKDRGRRQAEQQAREREVAAQQSVAQAAQPTPTESRLEADNLAFLDDVNSPNFDIRNTRGMAPHVQIYDAAASEQEGERQGQGLITMGANATDPTAAARIREVLGARRKQGAAGALERAFAMRNAEVQGSALPLMGLQQNRTMGLAGLQSGRADNSWNNYWKIRSQPSFIQQMMLAGWGQAANAASMGAGG